MGVDGVDGGNTIYCWLPAGVLVWGERLWSHNTKNTVSNGLTSEQGCDATLCHLSCWLQLVSSRVINLLLLIVLKKRVFLDRNWLCLVGLKVVWMIRIWIQNLISNLGGKCAAEISSKYPNTRFLSKPIETSLIGLTQTLLCTHSVEVWSKRVTDYIMYIAI